MNDRVQEVADALLGTQDDLHDHADFEEMRDQHFNLELKEKVCQCVECQTWTDPEDSIPDGDEFICSECWDNA